MSSAGLHNKYRPKTLDEIVGHSDVVERLKGAISSGKTFPSAVAFFGPPSAGKTTFARAFAASALGVPFVTRDSNPNFTELVGTDNKTIDEVRSVAAISRTRPMGAKRRFIFLDEAQGLLSNQQAVGALLGALESPPATTTWIIGSMEPEKFNASKNGRAMLSRCIKFNLARHSLRDLYQQATRIARGEEMTYVNKEILQAVVKNSDGTMRAVANMLESIQLSYEGMAKKPKMLDLSCVPGAVEDDDVQTEDQLVVSFVKSVYEANQADMFKAVLQVNDGFRFINNLVNAHWNAISARTVGPNSPIKVPIYGAAGGLLKYFSTIKGSAINTHLSVHEFLVSLKTAAATFAVPEQQLIMAMYVRWAANRK